MFDRLMEQVERKNPEVLRSEDVDDFFATFDVKGSSVSISVFDKSYGEDASELIGISGDVPVRPDDKDHSIMH